ncbi:MAG: protein phosphatase 2C domain-containing protein [Acidimicrobiia bacterium]
MCNPNPKPTLNSLWWGHGAKTVGPHHPKCEDHYNIVTTNDYVIVAVADGAGTAPKGGQGAKTAVESVTNRAAWHKGWGEGPNPTTLIKTAIRALKHNPMFATTLSVVVIGPTTIRAAAIGDSPIVVVTKPNNQLLLWYAPQPSEYVNETEFVTSPNPTITQWEHPTNQTQGVVVATDGINHLGIVNQTLPHPGLFVPLVQRSTQHNLNLSTFIGFIADRHLLDDDLTICVATPNTNHNPNQ